MFTPGIITYNNLVPENIGNFERTDAFSVEMWFNPSTARMTYLISHIIDATKQRGWAIYIVGGRTTFTRIGVFLVSDVTKTNYIHGVTAPSGFSFSINTWHHIIFTYTGNSHVSGMKCYLDNSLKSLTTIVGDNLIDTIKDNLAKLELGHAIYVNPCFPGKIDECVIYNRVLSASEISQRYNAGAGTENLFGSAYLHYHLNELSGSVVNDSSGNSRNGITINSPLWVDGKLNKCIQLNGTTQYIQA
jgi:hypothetical protein